MSRNNQFSERAFVAGSMTGIRTFAIDKFGRLCATQYNDAIWVPGENEAVCQMVIQWEKDEAQRARYEKERKREQAKLVEQAAVDYQQSASGFVQSYPPSALSSSRQTEIIRGCGCQLCDNYFTAVDQGKVSPAVLTLTASEDRHLYENRNQQTVRLVGNVSMGYNTASIGTFTASLATEGYTPPKDHEVAMQACTCGFYAYLDNLANEYHHNDEHFMYGVVEGYGVCTVGNRGFRASKAKIKALIAPGKRSVKLNLVLENYYDIPMFSTEADALAEFPLSLPMGLPSPKTDDDFWTRKA